MKLRCNSEELLNPIELVSEQLWVVEDNRGHSIELKFYEWETESDTEINTELFMTVNGTLNPLREMRHTRFRDDGYIFYLNRANLDAALDHCANYFDMDG